jgi:IgA Peptidase M64
VIDQLSAQPGSTLTALDGKLTIVFVADGFRQSELPDFRLAVSKLDAALRITPPLDGFRDIINVLRLETDSPVSGTTIPRTCPSPASNTRFKTTFCAHRSLERTLSGNGSDVVATLERFPPLQGKPYHPIVLFNSGLNGGITTEASITSTGGTKVSKTIAWITLEGGGVEPVLHELGHSLFRLDDEYEYDGPVRVHQPFASEYDFPNVTSFSTALALKSSDSAVHRFWASLIKPTTPTPSTKQKFSNDPLDDDALADGVGPDDVGLFEGAAHRTKGLFRPRANCRMRNDKAGWCPVCQYAIRARLNDWQLPNPIKAGTATVGPVTHTAMLAAPDRTFIIVYDAATGQYKSFNSTEFMLFRDHDSWSPPNASIGPGWTAIVGFTAGLTRGVLAHDALSGRRALFRLDAGQKGQVVLTPVFADGPTFGESWTALSVVDLGGTPCMLGYNFVSGIASIARLDIDSATPGIVELHGWRTAVEAWQPGWTHVFAFSVRGVPHVLRSSINGARDINPLLPIGTRPRAWAPGDPVQAPGFTHVLAYQLGALNGTLRHAAATGITVFEQLRPSLTAFDTVGERQLAPGALTVLGIGATIFAFAPTVENPKRSPPAPPIPTLVFHHAPSGTLQSFSFGAIAG